MRLDSKVLLVYHDDSNVINRAKTSCEMKLFSQDVAITRSCALCLSTSGTSPKASSWISARPRPPVRTPPPAQTPTSSWPSSCRPERRRKRTGGGKKRRRSWRGFCNSHLRRNDQKKRWKWRKDKRENPFTVLRLGTRLPLPALPSIIACIVLLR